MPEQSPPFAPAIQASAWLHAEQPIALDDLRGRVVLLHFFQMLCPACVSHGLPQASRVLRMFERADLAVIGVHSVFEHHAVMTPSALRAFVHEYRLEFPVAIDQSDADDPIPLTMRAYGLQGTPSLVLLDREGRVRLNHFGLLDDLALGAALGQLIASASPPGTPDRSVPAVPDATGCSQDACVAPGPTPQ